MVENATILAFAGIVQAIAAGALFFASHKAGQMWSSALDAQRAAEREREQLRRERRTPSLGGILTSMTVANSPPECPDCGKPLGPRERAHEADECRDCRDSEFRIR